MARVLIVDDNLLIRTLLREMLEHGEHVVVGEALDGIEAVSSVGQLDPDLVILDLVIPRRDGLATLEHLSRDHPTVPVIICSAGLTRPRVVQALRFGATAFIAKPFTLATLLDTVTKVMDRSAAAVSPSSTSEHADRDERRSFPRARISLPVVLTPSIGSSIRALTVDVSGGGMLLTTSPLAPGAEVDFALEVDPSEAPITGSARAVREQAQAQQALAFERVALAGHERLMRFISGLQQTAAPAAGGVRRQQERPGRGDGEK